MSERLVVHGATAEEVPTIAVELPRLAAQMERAVKGSSTAATSGWGSRPMRCAVWEKFAEPG